MKLHAKKSLSLHRQAISRTGGGPKPPSPSKEVVELVELIPLEFQEVFNEYDSNGPPTNVKTEVPETEGEQSCEVPCRPESTSAVLIEDENVEILLTSAPATPKVVNDEKCRKRKISKDEDDSRKRIAKLAGERSKVLLEQQEAEHKKKMEILDAELKMKIDEHNERMRILRQETEINSIKHEILNIKKQCLLKKL
ncbi:uncharacterized protein [Periplaneta americana]|uniref:uncharacterized protein isoform X1 n=1 Tax=Periplaneta americana TaxID=6978 RepID=UPI0037E74DE2